MEVWCREGISAPGQVPEIFDSRKSTLHISVPRRSGQREPLGPTSVAEGRCARSSSSQPGVDLARPYRLAYTARVPGEAVDRSS